MAGTDMVKKDENYVVCVDSRSAKGNRKRQGLRIRDGFWYFFLKFFIIFFFFFIFGWGGGYTGRVAQRRDSGQVKLGG